MSISLIILIFNIALFVLSCALMFIGHIATAALYFKVTRIKNDVRLKEHLQGRPEFSLFRILFSFRTGAAFLTTIVYPPPLFPRKTKRKTKRNKGYEFNHIYLESHPNIAFYAKMVYQNAIVSTILMLSAILLILIYALLGYAINHIV